MPELDLNSMLDVEEIIEEDTTADTLATSTEETVDEEIETVDEEIETVDETEVEETEATEDDSPSEEAAEEIVEIDETANEGNGVDASAWTSLFTYITDNQDSITNANRIDISGFSQITEGKYFLFCTEEEDADLILYAKPDMLWLPSDMDCQSIRIENSGIIITATGRRVYAGKNNLVVVDLNDEGISTKMSFISRSAEPVKIVEAEAENTSVTIDDIRLHAKAISPRLYTKIEDIDDLSSVKDGILSFMGDITDLNHLIKIEKDILLKYNV